MSRDVVKFVEGSIAAVEHNKTYRISEIQLATFRDEGDESGEKTPSAIENGFRNGLISVGKAFVAEAFPISYSANLDYH